MSERQQPPPPTYEVWTLDKENVRQTHLGGSPDMQSAVMLACTVAQLFRVPVTVVDDTDTEVAYLRWPDAEVPV